MKNENKKNVSGHPTVSTGKTGVLIVNLGTPPSLNYWDIRWYLKEFLEDRRVVELNPIFWRTLLNGVLLNFIPFKSRRNYAKIWNKEKNESPLLTFTRAQKEALEQQFPNENIVVDFAMRYGQPSIQSRLENLKKQGCRKILVFPLYPQYSAVTVGSVCDATFDALKKMRWMPTIRIVPPYFDHPEYINALAESAKPHLEDEETTLLASYHGIPLRYFKNGDPYPCHCQKTTRLLKEKLGLSDDRVLHSYQSQFGKDEWIKPATDKMLEDMPKEGRKKVVVISPAFASDCVETLEELALEGKEEFLEAGGESYHVVPCLNDSENSINMLTTIIKNELQGW